MTEKLSPRLWDISISHDMMLDHDVLTMPPAALGILLRLVWQAGVHRVWTMDAPDPLGRLPLDETRLARMAMVSPAKLRKYWPEIGRFFRETEGGWVLDREWVEINCGTLRPTIPASLRTQVMQRDDYRCGYCGGREGPFDCDHIIPVSQGGVTEIDNLTCACATCNRQKGARTPGEWMR